MCNGFAGVQNTLTQGFAGLNQNIVSQGYENRLQGQQLAAQLASCCCDIREGISGVNYNMATQFNALGNTICGATRDIIENQNCNYRALHDELVASKLEAKNERIAEQQAQITALQLAASQAKQNEYLISELKPCPRPAYITCNPYQSYPYYNGGCGNGSIQ